MLFNSTHRKDELLNFEVMGRIKNKDLFASLSQIVHSGDTDGHWSSTPNPFRDPKNKFDPEAQKILDKANK